MEPQTKMGQSSTHPLWTRSLLSHLKIVRRQSVIVDRQEVIFHSINYNGIMQQKCFSLCPESRGFLCKRLTSSSLVVTVESETLNRVYATATETDLLYPWCINICWILQPSQSNTRLSWWLEFRTNKIFAIWIISEFLLDMIAFDQKQAKYQRYRTEFKHGQT